MKARLLKMFVPMALVFTMISCSKEEAADDTQLLPSEKLVTEYNYNEEELALANLINEYRVSIGKSELQIVNHISYKSEEHNDYMIVRKEVNHDYFEVRSNNIIQLLGAVKVGENVAYNFSTPNAALHAWLASSGHKLNIEGDYTHFGISISTDPETGKKYFTNMFMKR
jgi:uncharacterized protein YkwD